jgi:hypothetical protein
MNKNSSGLILVLLFVLASNVLSQFESEYRIKNIITDTGFENVRIKSFEKNLYVEFENRLYRFEVTALFELLKLIKNEISDFNNIYLLIKNKNIPLAEVEVAQSDLINWFNNNITNSEFSELIEIRFDEFEDWEKIMGTSDVSNSSNMKFDLVLKPTYRFQFGIFSQPVLYQLNFTPHIQFGLWKGMSGLYELTIPLHNDFSPREDSVRTSMVVLNQTMRLSNSFLLSLSLGYFSLERYGFDVEARNYFSNGDISVGINLGYTGYASFTMRRMYYSDLYQWTGSVDLSYRIPEYDLSLCLTAGKFLSNDNIIRFDIYREFSEIQIGFFVMRSTKGISNGGFNFSVPLFPSKYWKPGFVRIRTTENIGHSYKVKIAEQIGLKYDTGFGINNFLKKMNPGFIKNYINNRIIIN